MKFTEYDDMILLVSLESVTKRLNEIKASGNSIVRWQYERGANHTHAFGMSSIDRKHVRQELEIATRFRSALSERYPDRSFVITHIPCYAVSFYQVTGDAPTSGILPVKGLESRRDTAWCQTRERKRAYQLLTVPDPAFPEAEWGVCDVCGIDLIVYTGEILTLLKSRA